MRVRAWTAWLFVGSLLLISGCGGHNNGVVPLPGGGNGGGAHDTTVNTWDNALLQAVRETGMAPTITARALAVMHTAMYDAWTAYDATAIGTQTPVSWRRPDAERTLANKQRAVSYAAFRSLLDLFPAATQQSEFTAVMNSFGFNPADSSTDVTTATGIGNVAAQRVLAFRHHDGSNQLGDLAPGAYADYTGYAPVNTPTKLNDPSRWQPLIVNGNTQHFTTPQWYLVTPFALTSGSQLRPPPPAAYGTPAFVAQTQQIINYSANLTDTQKAIAEFWADYSGTNTPPGHWCVFANVVSERDHHTIDQDVKLLFAVANALLDASIGAWDAKRAYDYVRPITAVHTVFAGQMITAWAGPGQGVRSIHAEDWQPYQPANVVTPPFPEYTSGHSTFSASAAEIFKLFTGSDTFGNSVTVLAGSSKVEPGISPAGNVTLSWPTFTAAADEAGLSRRYGGIHFEQGDLRARAMGRTIGDLVWTKAQRLFSGLP